MADLEELARRLEEAQGPDRDLDGEIMFTLFAKPVGENGFLWPEDSSSWSFAIRFPGKTREWFKPKPEGGERILVWRDGHPILMNELRVPKLTASLDAAIALCERVLPDWDWSLNKVTHGDFIVDMAPHGVPGAGPTIEHRTLALALCLAIVRALQSAPTEERGR